MEFFKRLFKRTSSKSDSAEFVTGFLDYQISTMEMQLSAKADAGPAAMLTPAVPLPVKDAAGWFGGAARLPEGAQWPEIDGVQLCFVAQIDLAKVPQNIWSGLGPRHGHFAFFVHPQTGQAKLLHVDGPLKREMGPSPVNSFCWYNRFHGAEPVGTHFPEWPVQLTGIVGEIPEPAGFHKGEAPGYPCPSVPKNFDWTDRAHHPFDEETLEMLIVGLEAAIKFKEKWVDDCLTGKKLRNDTADALRVLQSNIESSYAEFLRIKEELEPYTSSFDYQKVEPHLQALSQLSFERASFIKDDEDGYADIKVLPSNLTPSGFYLGLLERHARYAYTEFPEKLSPEARARFEKIWSFDAIYERGAMSHPPRGFIYTPHGPSSPNEVLLELPTSYLLGWKWGDGYSLVLTIARDDLANGRYDEIEVDITN